MTTDYKPLTPKQLYTIYQRVNSPEEENSMSGLMRAVEQAAIENYLAQHPAPQDIAPVGEAGTMPGTSGFTMACFKAADVPVGTKLYTVSAPQDAQAGEDAELKLLRGLVAEMAENRTYETEYDGRMYSICHGCGAQDEQAHRSGCLYIRADAAIAAAKGKE